MLYYNIAPINFNEFREQNNSNLNAIKMFVYLCLWYLMHLYSQTKWKYDVKHHKWVCKMQISNELQMYRQTKKEN